MRWFGGVAIAVLCGSLVFAASDEAKHKPKKAALPPLPSGPTGRQVPQIPLDAIAPVPPEVSFQSGQLTIVAPNSTLSDILKAVHKQTGAEIEIPSANDRVVTRLGPGPALDVMAELLNGSRFNYVLLGSPEDPNQLTKVVLVAKSGPEVVPGAAPQPQQQPAQARVQPPNPAAVPAADASTEPPDAGEAEATEEPADANTPEQPADAEQQAAPADQTPKTPQQLLQEMQQRQLQMQQQQGQAPVPGQGVPQPPPQNPPQQQQ
jgi:hypothetical protein